MVVSAPSSLQLDFVLHLENMGNNAAVITDHPGSSLFV